MDYKKKSLDKLALIKYGITTLFFIDLIRRLFESAIEFNSIGMIISIIVVSLLALGGFKNEFDDVQLYNKPRADHFSTKDEFKIIITYTFASFATYLGASFFDVNVTLAASIVVLAMVYFIHEPFTDFQGTVYTGTFTGMVSNQFIVNWRLALLLGLFGSILFLFFQPSYKATGGRAGLNAYMSTFIFTFLFSGVTTTLGTPIDRNMILPSFLLMVGSAFAAYLLEERKVFSGVQSAMAITLLLNLLIPSHLGVLINAGFTGSFMGTTGSERIRNLPFLFLVELFTFLLFIPAYPLLAGLGGKLGMLTLIGYMAADGTRNIINRFIN